MGQTNERTLPRGLGRKHDGEAWDNTERAQTATCVTHGGSCRSDILKVAQVVRVKNLHW